MCTCLVGCEWVLSNVLLSTRSGNLCRSVCERGSVYVYACV